MKKNKIVVIGCGYVGFSYIEKIVLEPNLSAEIVLIDLEGNPLKGEVLDMEQGLTLKTSSISLRVGNYEDCRDADLVVITAGVAQSQNDRMKDLEAANKIIRQITKQVMAFSFQGIFLVASNPLDVMSQFVATYADYPYEKVIGTGTMLDTARLKSLLSKKLNIRAKDIQVYVLGEHGNSQFVAWSNANVGLQNLSNFLSEAEKEELAAQTVQMGGEIIRLKHYTDEGVACCLSRLTMVILNDEKAIYPVSHFQREYDTYFSTPAVIGKNGIERTIDIKLSQEETLKLEHSAKKIKEAIAHILPPELY